MPIGSNNLLDTEGRSIGPLRLHRGLRLNVLAGCLIVAAFGIISPGAAIMTIFLREYLYAGTAIIGLSAALFTLGPCLSIIGAPLFDSAKRRRPLWVVLTTLGRAAYLPLFLAPMLADREELRPYLLVMVIAMGAIAMAIGGITSVGWWSWMASLIPESMRGRFFGYRNRTLLIVAAVVPLAAGAMLDWLPAGPVMTWLFLVAAILAIADPLLFWWVPEPARQDKIERISIRQSLRKYLEPLRDRGFRTFLYAVGLRLFAGGLPAPFLVLYLRSETVNGQTVGCGASFLMITLAGAIGTIAGVASSGWWGRLADKVGHRLVFLFGCSGYIVQLAYGLLSPSNYIWLLPIVNALGMLLGVGAGVAMSNLLIGISPQKGRDYYVATFTVITSIVAAVAPWVGGLIGHWVPVLPFHMPSGQPATYYHLLIVLSFLIMLLSIGPTLRIPDTRGDDVGISLLRLARGGLVRTIYQLGIISQTDDPLRRARALHTVRGEAASMAFGEISEALDDPAPQVRRAAVMALGRLGTDKALELLMWCMHESDAATREVAAAAIGEMPGPQGVFLLVGALTDPDARVRLAAAVAVGKRADKRMLGTLRRRFKEDPDAEVQVAAGRALAYMHDYESVADLTDATLNHPSRLARLQMTIALGGIFGQAGDFYRHWRRDRQVPGTSFSRLVRRLARTARRALKNASRKGMLDLAELHSHLHELRVQTAKMRSFFEADDWIEGLVVMDDMLRHVASSTRLEAKANVAACIQCIAMLRQASTESQTHEAIRDGMALAALYAAEAVLARPAD